MCSLTRRGQRSAKGEFAQRQRRRRAPSAGSRAGSRAAPRAGRPARCSVYLVDAAGSFAAFTWMRPARLGSMLGSYIRHSPYSDLAIPISQTGAFGVRLGFGAGRVGGAAPAFAGRHPYQGTPAVAAQSAAPAARVPRPRFHGFRGIGSGAFSWNRFLGFPEFGFPEFEFSDGTHLEGGSIKKGRAIHFGQVATGKA